jgi:N-acetylglucosaminyldiphosphoundecaprenol N-acetyl-beta-D-mannosaminyltransferase
MSQAPPSKAPARGAGTSPKTLVVGVPVSEAGVEDVTACLDERPADRAFTVTFVNPHACYLLTRHDDYRVLLEAFDRVGCDGIGMVVAARLLGLGRLQREAFDLTSLAVPVLKWAARNGKPVGLVGGHDGVARQAAGVLQQLFPGLQIRDCFSGYGEDPEAALRHFSREQTELVICGMGSPLQERFLLQLVAAGWRGAGFTCGGFLDQTARGGEYFPAWIDRLNLRFAYRLAREPRRLWRRYLLEYRYFVFGFIGLLLSGRWLRSRAKN